MNDPMAERFACCKLRGLRSNLNAQNWTSVFHIVHRLREYVAQTSGKMVTYIFGNLGAECRTLIWWLQGAEGREAVSQAWDAMALVYT